MCFTDVCQKQIKEDKILKLTKKNPTIQKILANKTCPIQLKNK